MTDVLMDPVAVAKELVARENAHDVDGAIALFADHALVISSMDRFDTLLKCVVGRKISRQAIFTSNR